MTDVPWSVPAIGERIMDIVAEVSGVARATLRPGTLLRADLGLDELGVMEVLVFAEKIFDVSIPTDSLALSSTIADVADSVRAALSDPPPPMTRRTSRGRRLRLRWR
jgi:acyl carrier protein